MAKDYYKILDVDKNASQDDIKKAFRKLAHKYHPDKSDGDATKFKEANEAYSVLSDEKKRQQYDTYGSAGPMGGGGGAGFDPSSFGGFDFSQYAQQGNSQGFEFDLGDVFADFFGGGAGGRGGGREKRGHDISIDVEISFTESIFGVEYKVTLNKTSACSHCKGTRAEPGTDMRTCSTCDGRGKISETKRSFLGQFSTTRTCDTCGGTGKVPTAPCKQCKGAGVLHGKEEISVQIPSGIENGEMVRMTGEGEAIANGKPGDLYLKIHIKPHKLFRKEGNNLVADVSVKLSTALLGGELPLETLDGSITIKIPAGVTFGEILRVRGKGVPYDKNKRGDLLVRISIEIPGKISKNAAKLIEDLKKEGI